MMFAAYSSSTKPHPQNEGRCRRSRSRQYQHRLHSRKVYKILQPEDICWNKSFKDSLHMSWAEFISKGEKTPKRNLRKPSHQDMLNFVSTAWAAVSKEMVARSFKGCVALDSSEDGHLHNRLAGTREPVVCSSRVSVSAECIDLLFFTDSEESFAGFSDDE
ncbi:hypothetical protein HPB49_004279 [Dermacentor silvarum]|uniref:Uncharacterized protein n=1 Tax=Dermacentor silvarum TaxID=543639 RepID=A0ACB8DAW6_DERSI|nr:hypothetical protein HPB49_004279 [Dermacentor silvarum]